MKININIDTKLVNEQKVNMAGVESILISYKSSAVYLYKSDTEELVLKEYMNFEPEDGDLAEITINKGKLAIEGERIEKISFGYNRRISEIYIPSSYKGDLEVCCSSGSIKSDEDFRVTNFKALSRSGSIKLKDIYADNVELQASSGSVSIETAQGNIKIKSSSGSIKLLNGCGDSDISSSSGSITASNIIGKLKAKASSGSIKASINELKNDIDLEASSGSITLTLPQNLGFNFSAKTSSGSIKTYFDNQLSYNTRKNQATGKIGEEQAVSIRIQASSGSVKVTN